MSLEEKDAIELWGDAVVNLLRFPDIYQVTEESISMKLLTPVKDKTGETITEISFNEPEMGQMRRLDKIEGDVSKAIEMCEIIGGLSSFSAGKIRSRDMARLTKIVDVFFGFSDGSSTKT